MMFYLLWHSNIWCIKEENIATCYVVHIEVFFTFFPFLLTLNNIIGIYDLYILVRGLYF